MKKEQKKLRDLAPGTPFWVADQEWFKAEKPIIDDGETFYARCPSKNIVGYPDLDANVLVETTDNDPESV